MLGVQNKLFVSIITTFPCIKQNPTLIDCLLAIDLVSCNIDKVKVNITSPSKDYSHFGTTPSAREEWAWRSVLPIPDQGQYHDNIILCF